jgi:glycosyltransferase involved in cell wall biosynthesis
MSTSKRFTIALPVRNGGRYLQQCVESVLAQNCGDFDLAVLDNASDDGGAEWLATVRDPRVTVHRSERALGIEENWARIKTIPKNEYLTTIGHDDLLHPEFLEVISRLIHKHPDAGLYYTHYRLIDADGAVLRSCRPMPARESAAEFLAARLCELRDSFGTGHVLRSANYDAIGGIPPYPKLLFADDSLFLQAIGASYRATALDETFSYRWHAASASTGCAMAELFAGLERYGSLLATLRDRDADLAEVLRRYFPGYAAHVGRLWRREAMMKAYRERQPLDPGLDARVARLASLFGPIPTLAPWPGERDDRFLERAIHSRVGRVLYTAWWTQRQGRARLSDWLFRLRARGAGAAPQP